MIRSSIGIKKWRSIKGFLRIIPFLIFIFAFEYVPLLGWLYAFCDFKPGQSWNTLNWVGLKHFQRFFTDGDVFRVLRNTLVMNLMELLITPVPVLFAIFFNDIRSKKVKKVVQTITTMPHFISWIIVFGLSQAIFDANGLLNQVIKLFGGTPSPFGLMGDGDHVWIFQVLLGLWKGLGWSTIVYMAAITGLDQELYDAAKVDGANKVQTIRYITIPGIAPTYLVLLIMKVSRLLSSGFDQYYQFYNSLVADKIEVLEYYVYRLSFSGQQYSFGIAVGILQSLVAIILLFITNAIARKIRGSSIV
ncbi:MAG: sugar ABC transporter permease [Lachnospiraceae bacterium]|nr:sugar ABC transporter permease [Lachnospiraceae bacterium]